MKLTKRESVQLEKPEKKKKEASEEPIAPQEEKGAYRRASRAESIDEGAKGGFEIGKSNVRRMRMV